MIRTIAVGDRYRRSPLRSAQLQPLQLLTVTPGLQQGKTRDWTGAIHIGVEAMALAGVTFIGVITGRYFGMGRAELELAHAHPKIDK